MSSAVPPQAPDRHQRRRTGTSGIPTAKPWGAWLGEVHPEALLYRANLLRARAVRAELPAAETGLLRAARACDERALAIAARALGDDAAAASEVVASKYGQAHDLLTLAWRADDPAGVEAMRKAAYALIKDAEHEIRLVAARAARLQHEQRKRRAHRDQKRRLGLD